MDSIEEGHICRPQIWARFSFVNFSFYVTLFCFIFYFTIFYFTLSYLIFLDLILFWFILEIKKNKEGKVFFKRG